MLPDPKSCGTAKQTQLQGGTHAPEPESSHVSCLNSADEEFRELAKQKEFDSTIADMEGAIQLRAQKVPSTVMQLTMEDQFLYDPVN